MPHRQFKFSLARFMLIVALAGILVAAAKLLWDPPGERENWASAVAFSPDAKTIAASLFVFHRVQSWNPTARMLGADASQSFFLLGLPDLDARRTLERTTRPGTISVAWPVRRMGLGHSVAFSPDGSAVATQGLDNKVSIWNIGSDERIRELSTTDELSNAVSWASDGTLAASAGNACYVLRPSTSALKKVTTRGFSFVSLVLSRDGRKMVTADDHGKIELWDTDRRCRLRELGGGGSPFYRHGLAMTPDGLLIGAESDGVTRVWDAASGAERFAWKTPEPILALAFSPDGNTLAAAGTDGKLRLLSLNGSTNKEIDVGVPVATIAYSHDGALLATGDSRSRVCLWDPQTKNLLSQARLYHGWTVPHWSILAGASVVWLVLWCYVRPTPFPH